MSQLGISIGIAVLAVISNTVTDGSAIPDKESPDALMQGFRAVFWTCFAMMVLSTLVGMWGLQGWKKIGTSKESEQATSKAEQLFSPAKSNIRRLVIQKESLPPDSVFRAQSRSGFGPERSGTLNSINKALPGLPPDSKLPAFEVSSFEDTVDSLGAGAGVTLDHILRLYDRSQISLAEGHDVLDEFYFKEV